MKPLYKLFYSFGITFGLNFISKFFTDQGVKTWYLTLNRSFLTPPSYVFGLVWPTLYILMSYATYLIWKDQKQITFPIIFYFGHLLLNVLWCYTFFALHNKELSLAIIIILLGAIGYLIHLFYQENKFAAYLLLPYFCWVSFATYLSLQIVLLN